MFTLSTCPNLHEKSVPRLTIGGRGKVYSIDMDGAPYLEIEVAPNSWNPFQAECFFQQYFCIGSGEAAYFINLQTREIKTLQCDLYFGYFYIHKERLYVASNSRLFCFNCDCELLWQTEEIAVDGLVVDEFSEDSLSVSCEVDPPDHWIPYKISLHDGKILSYIL